MTINELALEIGLAIIENEKILTGIVWLLVCTIFLKILELPLRLYSVYLNFRRYKITKATIENIRIKGGFDNE